ncbi:MAG: FGGY family carbohydrate kinase, partial [Pseudomonadales bacterium]
MSILLSIDQGTTSSRCIAFDEHGTQLASAQQEFAQHFPRDGWVEHDPEDIWQTTLVTLAEVIAALGATSDEIAAIGISNQRETTVVWDRGSGKPVYPAIVWQDRRTAEQC